MRQPDDPEDPTQALLACLTIREYCGAIGGLTVAIVGELLHSRVGRSNVHALRARRAYLLCVS